MKKEKEIAVKSDKPSHTGELARRGPSDLFDAMRADFEDFWASPWRSFRSRPHLSSLMGRGEAWLPSTDVLRENGTLVVKADLPGMTKDDVRVSLDNGDLVVEGERKQEEKVEEKDYLRSERSYGSFYRRLPLPEGVKPNEISAHVFDGVLEVRVPLPKEVTHEPARIEVR